MGIPNLKNWKTALLLSIIVPLSMLISFKLAGLINEPPTITENITLKTVEWSFTRPSAHYVVYDKLLQVTFLDDDASGNFNLMIFDFVGNVNGMPAEVRMKTEINWTVGSGAFIDSVSITFYEKQTLSIVAFQQLEFEFQNLSCTHLNYRYGSGVKAYLRAVGVNQPNAIFLSAIVYWKLFSPISQSHEMSVVYEVVYYDGMAYKKIVQPYHIKLLGSGG